MKRAVLATAALGLALQATAADSGLVTEPSRFSVQETIDRVERVTSARGLTTFARIDHSAEAARVGLSLQPMQLLVFGNPKGGTPLMSAAPTLGLDLPLKVLAWEGADGRVWITYNSPDYLGQRHGLDPDARKGLAPVAGLVEAALK
jgi:uncharacterized protein (DUF302 family)